MTPLLLGLQGPELTPTERELFTRIQPAGYILFSRNIASPRQTRELTDSLRQLHSLDPILAIDQEGGRVTRTKEIAPVVPSAPDLAALGDPAKIGRAGVLTADLLRLLGFNLNFAPVLDLDHFPGQANALRGRAWGRDPQRVIDHAGTWNRWMRKRSMRSCGKHFPAGGRALSDPHHDLPVSDASKEELLAEDVLPFTALMPELDAIMLSHVLFPKLDPDRPASLSPRVIRDFLRGQLGFDKHLVLTDDLDMGAIADRYPDNTDVVAALEAGNDLAMICHRIERADDAASRLAALPGYLLADTEQRVERFRNRLHGPLVWSEDKWRQFCDEISELAGSVPATTDGDQAGSPVADY